VNVASSPSPSRCTAVERVQTSIEALFDRALLACQNDIDLLSLVRVLWEADEDKVRANRFFGASSKSCNHYCAQCLSSATPAPRYRGTRYLCRPACSRPAWCRLAHLPICF
jgi:hypothetical protein